MLEVTNLTKIKENSKSRQKRVYSTYYVPREAFWERAQSEYWLQAQKKDGDVL